MDQYLYNVIRSGRQECSCARVESPCPVALAQAVYVTSASAVQSPAPFPHRDYGGSRLAGRSV